MPDSKDLPTFGSSLKATDPIAGLERAQADYEAADAGFRTRQREILQDVFRNVASLIDDEEACRNFINDKGFAKYKGGKGDLLSLLTVFEGDRPDIYHR